MDADPPQDMTAAVVREPGHLELRKLPLPSIGEYECLCEMLFGATCSGTDLHIIHGKFPFPLTYPTQLGHESVGRIIKKGPRVRHFEINDVISRVGVPARTGTETTVHSHWGGFSHYGVAVDHRAMRADGIPRDRWDQYRIHQIVPSDLDPRGATMIVTWRETLSYATRMGMGAGHTVLILGSGGNGLAFAAHARNLGAATIAMIGSAGRREAAGKAGATRYVDYRAPSATDALSRELAGQVDFLIDAVGGSKTVNRLLGTLRRDATVGIYGIDDFDGCGINPWKARDSFRIYQGGYDEEEAHDQVIAHIRAGRLNADLWLGSQGSYPLTSIQDAFTAVKQRAEIKAVVNLRA